MTKKKEGNGFNILMLCDDVQTKFISGLKWQMCNYRAHNTGIP